MPRTGAPPITGETPTTVLALTASAIPGIAEDDPDTHDGVGRRQQDEVGPLDRIEHAWRGLRALGARER